MLDHDDEELKAGAIRALGVWPDTGPMADLLNAAKHSENRTHRILALRGYINLIGIGEDLSGSDRLELYKGAMILAEEDQEKIRILSELSGVFSLEALRFIKPYLQDKMIQTKAAAAAVTIAHRIYAQDMTFTKALVDWISANIAADYVRQHAREVSDLIENYRATFWTGRSPDLIRRQEKPDPNFSILN